MKINKKILLGKGYNKGFVWLNGYSQDENTDDIGRWARIGYFNGFMISWITGFIIKNDKIEDKRKVGVCNMFLVHLQFPTSSNQVGATEKFDNIEDAKRYTISMFKDFKRLINITHT